MINLCFLSGKVINKIDLQFVYDSKKIISIVKIELLLDDGQVINTCGYNEMADFIYRNINKEDTVLLEGRIINDIVEINEITII